MPTIVLLRHAQGSFGTADYDVLSETGRRQAAVTATALRERGLRPDRLISGTLRRQLETIEPWGGAPETDARWNEYDSADLLGAHSVSAISLESPSITSRDFQRALDEGMDAWIGAGEDSTAAEPWPAFRGRVEAALTELAASLAKGQTALVVTSGGVIAACCVLVLGVPDALLPTFNRTMVNGSLTKLIVGGRGTSLLTFNDHAHLEAAGLMTFR